MTAPRLALCAMARVRRRAAVLKAREYLHGGENPSRGWQGLLLQARAAEPHGLNPSCPR